MRPGVRAIVAGSGSQCCEDGIKLLNYCILTADHHAIPAFESPDTAARADIHIVQVLWREFFRTPDIIDVIRIAPVDDNVSRFEMRLKVSDGLVCHGRGNHQPNCSRLFHLSHEVSERRRTDGLLSN